MQVLHQLPEQRHRALIAGINPADDAAVYRISKDLALIATLDFFPPVVDDPYAYGAIAAANALSDVYAMGGVPRLAMNIVCFPTGIGLKPLNRMLKGSAEKLKEAGVLLAGGHSIEDKEIKYGLSVVGFAHPRRITKNTGALPGDSLVLTKPVGIGIITTALKRGVVRAKEADQALRSMLALNKAASEAMLSLGAKAATDVTGFGLMGHAMGMAEGSGVSLLIDSSSVDVFPLARRLAMDKANWPGAIKRNKAFYGKRVSMRIKDPLIEAALYCPETSGGLLISIPGKKADGLVGLLQRKGVNARVIGAVVRREKAWGIKVV